MGTYTVRVQVWGDVRDRDVHDTILADYNAAHTDIAIENDHRTPPARPLLRQFAAGLAAGTVADLAYVQGWMWQEYAGKGALQPLDELASRDKWSTPWPADEAYDLQTTFRGKRYVSPSSTGTMLMYYVKEYFDRAGIAYPREGWTYTEFQDLCRRLTRQLDGKQVYAYQWNGGYLRNTPWWRMNNHLEWDRIAEPKKAVWNAGPVIEAYQYQLYDSQYKLRMAPTQQLLDADLGLQSPRARRRGDEGGGSLVPAPDVGPRRAREGGTAYDVQLLPRGKAAAAAHESDRRAGPDPAVQGQEAAWDVMKWIAGEKGQQRVADGGRMCNVPEAIRKFWLPSVRLKYNVANAEAFVKAIEGASINLASEVTENVLNRDAGLAQALTTCATARRLPRTPWTRRPRIQQVLDGYWAARSPRSARPSPGARRHARAPGRPAALGAIVPLRGGRSIPSAGRSARPPTRAEARRRHPASPTRAGRKPLPHSAIRARRRGPCPCRSWAAPAAGPGLVPGGGARPLPGRRTYRVMRTDTVGRVRCPQWLLDFGIAGAGDDLIHASVGELTGHLPPGEQAHWAAHAAAPPVSGNYLLMQLTRGACIDDGDVRRW